MKKQSEEKRKLGSSLKKFEVVDACTVRSKFNLDKIESTNDKK